MYGLLSEKENVSVCFVCLRAPRWIELELVAIASSPASSFPLSSTDDAVICTVPPVVAASSIEICVVDRGEK